MLPENIPLLQHIYFLPIYFLSTANPDVKYEISNSIIRLAVKGNVYHFNNVANTTTIYLTALPF